MTLSEVFDKPLFDELSVIFINHERSLADLAFSSAYRPAKREFLAEFGDIMLDEMLQ